MTDAEARRLCESAGLADSEMHYDPKLGLLISPSGVRKLAKVAPNQEAAQKLLIPQQYT